MVKCHGAATKATTADFLEISRCLRVPSARSRAIACQISCCLNGSSGGEGEAQQRRMGKGSGLRGRPGMQRAASQKMTLGLVLSILSPRLKPSF